MENVNERDACHVNLCLVIGRSMSIANSDVIPAIPDVL